MINHIVDVKVKPGRAADFCRAIQDNLSIWRAQPGFVDEIVLADVEADHIVAQSFWNTKEDADRFNADVFPRITAIVKDIMAAPPSSVTYTVAVSTNRNIVPANELAVVIAQPSTSAIRSGSFPLQVMKLPPAIAVSALELLLQLFRGAQSVYDSAVDSVLAPINGTRQAQAARPALPVNSPIETDIVRDTLNALIAFVVPGPDPYSVAQGESTPEPGGYDAGILDALIRTVNATQPATPESSASQLLAGVLNQIAQKVNPDRQGPFLSPFARLSMAEKAAVFQAIDADPRTRQLAGVLVITAFLVYSEGRAFDAGDRTLRSQPLGWALSNYGGVADGHDDLKGYFQDRRSVATDSTFSLF